MQMLSLADVVDAGHRGRMQKAQTQQLDRQNKAQGIYDEAGQRANQVLEAERQAHVAAGGDPAQFRPSDTAMLKASEAFGQTFADKGDWQGFLKNEASVHPQRLRVRQQALQRFQMDGDRAKLLKTVYATIPDGMEIAEVEDVKGGPTPDRGTNPTPTPMAPKPQGLAGAMQQFDAEVLDPMSQLGKDKPIEPIQPGRPGDGRLGAPSGPSKLRVKLNTGETRDVDFDQFLQDVQKMQVSPEEEIKLNYERQLARIKAGAQTEVVNARGAQARQTEAQKAEARKQQGLAAFDNAMKRDAANNEARKEVAQMRVDGQMSVAQMRAASGGGGGGGGGSSGGTGNKVQSRTEDADGHVVLVMRDGSHKYLVDDNGRRIKSLNYQKAVGRMAVDLGKQDMTPRPLTENRTRAEQLLSPSKPAAPAGARDLGAGIWK